MHYRWSGESNGRRSRMNDGENNWLRRNARDGGHYILAVLLIKGPYCSHLFSEKLAGLPFVWVVPGSQKRIQKQAARECVPLVMGPHLVIKDKCLRQNVVCLIFFKKGDLPTQPKHPSSPANTNHHQGPAKPDYPNPLHCNGFPAEST